MRATAIASLGSADGVSSSSCIPYVLTRNPVLVRGGNNSSCTYFYHKQQRCLRRGFFQGWDQQQFCLLHGNQVIKHLAINGSSTTIFSYRMTGKGHCLYLKKWLRNGSKSSCVFCVAITGSVIFFETGYISMQYSFKGIVQRKLRSVESGVNQ